MNPSTALATVLVDELVRNGVREAVLAPGSRSAPIAYALHAADAAGRLRLHVRIDERSAGFLALGLAKGSGLPVPVATTSGTATANLHPAVLEAHHTGTSLVVLTADRPPELRDSGANQTIDQVRLYGGAARFFEVGVPELRTGQNAYWRSLVCRALAGPGPVQLNLAFRDPLIPGPGDWPEPLEGRDDEGLPGPWTERLVGAPPLATWDDLPARTILVLADGAPRSLVPTAQLLAQDRGWPVVAEPSAGAIRDVNLIAVPDLLLTSGLLAAHPPERVLVLGRPTLSRAVARLMASAPLDVVAEPGWWPDAGRIAARVLAALPPLERAADDPAPPPDVAWRDAWIAASRAAGDAVESVLAGVPASTAEDRQDADASAARARSSFPLNEPTASRRVQAAVPDEGLLVVGSSKPVRDLFLVGPHGSLAGDYGWFANAPLHPGLRILANRGVAGIDGMVSTAIGAALAHQTDGGGAAYALLGDLTFLHDSNGLVIGPGEPRPDLTIVVVNNDGGAIFGTLEQGASEPAVFERIFGTPHGMDLGALCAASGTPFVRAVTLDELDAALLPAPGLRVVEVPTDRTAAVDLDRRLRETVQAVLVALAPLT